MEITIKETEPKEYCSMRLVKSEDLNHHGTLFAGRTAEWVVESGFIAATSVLDPRKVVCLNIHGMHFLHPVKLGEVLKFTSRIAWTGKSSLTAYINVKKANEEVLLVDGFITFIHVDENTKPLPHGIQLILKTDEQKRLFEEAAGLKAGGKK